MQYRCKVYSFFTVIIICCSMSAKTIYVNNTIGKDTYNGLAEKSEEDGKYGPVASIEKGISLLATSDVMEVTNTGKPYQQAYPGHVGQGLYIPVGGTLEYPLIINGNGAVVSGLAVILPENWKLVANNIYSLPFCPMSNMYKTFKQQNYWLDEPRIWWVDGKTARNCRNLDELLKTPCGFWWNKEQQKVFFHLPPDKQFKNIKIELPANHGFYITKDHTIIKNFTYMFSWNDGFDICGNPKNAGYKNCVAIDNCGQGFSCHDTGTVIYEDCSAIRCASSGSCDVHQSNSNYVRCIFLNNTFETGIYAADKSTHAYRDCLIAGNGPFEQIWQRGSSKMSFNNCVIIGGNDEKAIMDIQDGSISFKNCTIANAKYICSLPANFKAALNVENCVLANMTKYFFNFPASGGQLTLCGNLYLNGPGNYYANKIYNKATWPDYLKISPFEKCSEWSDLSINGFPQSEMPEVIKLKNCDGIDREVGAKLPESVWLRYNELLKILATPSGIVQSILK